MSVTIATLSGMARELPPDLRCLAQRQSGVVSRSQAIRAGLSPGMIKFRVRTGRWRQLHPGIYATFTGAPGRGARLWAAVLSAGPGAMLSHQTAAELQGLADKPVSPIHVTVPHARHVTPIDGVLPAPVSPGGGRAAGRIPPATDYDRGDGARPGPGRGDLRRRVRMGDPRDRAAARRRDGPAAGDEQAPEAALARGPARTYRRRKKRRSLGAGVPLPQGRGEGPRPARVGQAGAVRDAERVTRTPGPPVRALRGGHRARRAPGPPGRE